MIWLSNTTRLVAERTEPHRQPLLGLLALDRTRKTGKTSAHLSVVTEYICVPDRSARSAWDGKGRLRRSNKTSWRRTRSKSELCYAVGRRIICLGSLQPQAECDERAREKKQPGIVFAIGFYKNTNSEKTTTEQTKAFNGMAEFTGK